ncbi:uncharacterized protein LOC134697070 isoform X4 [Mytilus trossulus]|uniref:uncharacterized protein LOC134697070 isoform X4 n=1 Tax=Mytilus trossulus TaxID=6551 RepID=UPI003007D689
MSVHEDEEEAPDFPEDFGDLVMVDEIGSDDDETTAQKTDSSVKAQSGSPIKAHTDSPIKAPTDSPIKAPTEVQVKAPTEAPIKAPTEAPTKAPTQTSIKAPTEVPIKAPTEAPIKAPTEAPIKAPTDAPIKAPTDTEVVKIKKESNESVEKSSEEQVVDTIKKETQDHANIIKSGTSEKSGLGQQSQKPQDHANIIKSDTSEKSGSGQQSQKDHGKSPAIKTVPSLNMPRKRGKRIRPGQRQRKEAAKATEAATKPKPQMKENKITPVNTSKKADPKFGSFKKKRFQESSAGRRARRLRQAARAVAAAANRPNFGQGFSSMQQNFAQGTFGPNDPFQMNRRDMTMGPMNPDNNPQNRGFFREGLDFGLRQNDFMNEPYNTRFENNEMRREHPNFYHDEEEFMRRRHDVMFNEERERMRGGFDEQQDFLRRPFDIDDVERRQMMREHTDFSIGRPNDMHHRHMEVMDQGPNYEQDHRDFHMGPSPEKGNRQGFRVGPVLMEDNEVIPSRELANIRNDPNDFRKDFSSMEDDRLFTGKPFGFDRHDRSFGQERRMMTRDDDFERDKFVKDTFRGRNMMEDFPSQEFDRMDEEKRNKFVKDTLRGWNVMEDHPSREFDLRDDSKRDRFVKDTLRGKDVMEDFPSREFNWRDEEERNRRIDYPEREEFDVEKGRPFQRKLEKCPIPGCFIECNDLFYHASQKHIPGIFKTVEDSDKISQANVTPTRVAALRALKMAILGPQSSFNALMDLVNGIGIDVPKNEELASCHWAMVEVCQDQDWKVPDRFSLNPINSPAGLIHWRPILILISLLDEKRRTSILSAFPPAGKSSMDRPTSDHFKNSSNKPKEILQTEMFTKNSSPSQPKNSNRHLRNLQARRNNVSENSQNLGDTLQNTNNQRLNSSDTNSKRKRRLRNRNRQRSGKFYQPSLNINNSSHDDRADLFSSHSQGNPDANYQMGPRDSEIMSINSSPQARDRKIRSLFDSEVEYFRPGNTSQNRNFEMTNNRNFEMMNNLGPDHTSISQNFNQMRYQRGTFNEDFQTENIVRQQGLGFTDSVSVGTMGLSSLTRQMDRSFEGSLGHNTGNAGFNSMDGMQWGQGLDYQDQFQGNIPNQQMQIWSGNGNNRHFHGH